MQKIQKKKKNTKDQGFTLVEALISITILMISVAAPLNLAGKGLVAADIAQRQIVAFYLAQDATETIINIKTGNKLDNEGILEGLDNCRVDISPATGCYIDTIDRTISSCSGTDCSTGKLYKTTAGAYRHNSLLGSDSGFTRYVEVDPVTTIGGIEEEAEISTTVWWNAANGVRQTYNLTTNISNW